MLLEFTVKNMLSFKEKNTFSMIASSDNTLPDNYVKKEHDNILKVTAFYGANAS